MAHSLLPSPSKRTIGCIVITHRAKQHLIRCLSPLLYSPLKPRILVVNSSSEDGTLELAQSLGAETLLIRRSEFNHGTTRERARLHLGTDIIGLLTPDAYLVDEYAFEKLVAPILHGHASVTYARQIPHEGADFFESFPREYNYPGQSHTRGIDDMRHYGVYTFFCSNSCAAYSNAALDSIGGFQHVLLGEDTIAVSKLLREGHKIAYVAEALVHHSHRYSLWDEFQRHFDTGLARKNHADLLACEGSDSKRGFDYLQTMYKKLLKEAPQKLPYALAHIFAKWLGYRLGQSSVNAPIWWKKILSAQDFYWSSSPNNNRK